MSSENALVASPLHRGRQLEDSVNRYLPGSFYAPLVIAHQQVKMHLTTYDDVQGSSSTKETCTIQNIPRKQDDSRAASPTISGDARDNSSEARGGSDEDNEDSESLEDMTDDCTLTASAWLDACMQEADTFPDEHRDQDNDTMERVAAIDRPLEFDKHFLSYPTLPDPPSECDIPVFCMAEHAQLSVLVTALLYQRHTWDISEPLLGIGFSRYSTVIKLYIAWIDEEARRCILVSFSLASAHTIS